MRSMQGSMLAAVALVALGACAKEKAPEAAPAAAAPAVSPVVSSPPSAATIAVATAPAAPKAATMATSASSGALVENTAQAGDAGDSTWVAQADVDGDGTAQTATFVWDDERRILFIATDDDEVCAAGGVATANTLTALFATGNTMGAPVGSGWTATLLDATECGATSPIIWGERFDATGMVTASGVAAIDPATGDLVIAMMPSTDTTATPAAN